MLNDIYADVIDKDIYKYLNGTPVLKVKFFNTEGRTIYSSDKDQIGVIKPADYPGSVAAKLGKPISSLSHRDRFDSIEGELSNVKVLATYIPTYEINTSKVDGVFEIYTNVTEPLNNIDNSLFKFTVVLLIIFALVFCALYIMVQHADKVILKNKGDLNKKITEVENMNIVLEDNARELAIARDVANHANLSKSQFLANMSHELRTPLNAILGYTDIIKEDIEKYEDKLIEEDLSKVGQSGEHLLELIDSILDLSKIEAGEMELHLESFDLLHLLQEVADSFRPIINKNHNTLKLDVDFKDVIIVGDMLKIRQILLNLISNSAKFTTNGVIALKSRLLTINEETKVFIEVRDTGIGIAEKHLTKLFDPFEQADTSTTRQFGGTGLGLTITKRFVTMMDGEIEVDSKQGSGTKFIVYLPYVDGSSLSQEAV